MPTNHYVYRLFRDLTDETKLGRIVRGTLLEHISEVEVRLSWIIRDHFCKGKNGPQFMSLFLNERMTLSRKIEVLDSILHENYPHLVKKEPKLARRLEKLNKFRNWLAHGMSVLGNDYPQAMAKSIFLLRYKQGEVEQIQIGIEEIAKEVKEAEDILYTLSNLWLAMLRQQVPKSNG